MVRVQGIEHVYNVLEEGRGAIVFTAHFGNVDIVGQLPLAYGIPITGAVMRVKPERLFRYTLQLRQSHGLQLLPIDGPLLGLIRALRRGGIVALPCDRNIAGNSMTVDFFGAPASLPAGPVRIALRTGAPLIPVFVLRLPDDSLRVCVEPALDLRRTGDREADTLAGMKEVVRAMERHISGRPEQWLVAAPVWPMEEPG
jgi:KDO2-lipid IV(A) lauroyltransferase